MLLTSYQLLSLASLILTIVQYKKGVPEFDYNIAARNQWVTSVHWRFYDLLDSILTLTFIKLSVGALLLRFAQTRRQRVFLYCGIGKDVCAHIKFDPAYQVIRRCYCHLHRMVWCNYLRMLASQCGLEYPRGRELYFS